MDKDIQYLASCGNLLENLLREESHIYIVRFWTYETVVCSQMWHISDVEHPDPRDAREKQIVELLQKISNYCRFKLGWMDNKFAIELRVDPGWRIFVGYWDWSMCIGKSIIPNMYPPKQKDDKHGYPEYIRFR